MRYFIFTNILVGTAPECGSREKVLVLLGYTLFIKPEISNDVRFSTLLVVGLRPALAQHL